jgi:polysaccharide export outer membrane protein
MLTSDDHLDRRGATGYRFHHKSPTGPILGTRAAVHGTNMTRSARLFRYVAVFLTVFLVAACSSLPSSGPNNSQVLDQFNSAKNPLGAHVVDLSPSVVQILRNQHEPSLSIIDNLRSNRPVDLLGPGDVLTVTIYEAGNGLFSPERPGSTADNNSAGPTPGSTAETLPRLQVDRNGMIMVPYAGEIHVAGQTTTAVQRIIESRLAGKTAQPQVLVSLASNGSNIVYVSGDVKNPGRYPLSLAHENLLDMVALAGGPTHSPQDTLVKVNRRGQDASTSLTRIQTIAAENIPVEPLDRIQVDYLPRSYLSFGATGKVSQIQFDAATVSLAEAVARVGGLDDNRANPEAVFLFRYERPGNAEALGLAQPGAALATSTPVVPGAMAHGMPVIYKVNMRDPQTYFAIQQFAMQDKDLIYIANAPTVQIYKFLQLIYTFTSPLLTGAAVAPNL